MRESYSTDTLFSSITGIGGTTCAQIFVGKESEYNRVYGMHSESQGSTALETFITEVGAPYNLHSDNAKMQTSKIWIDILRKYNISSTTTEPYHPHQNPAERKIRDLKQTTNQILDRVGAPSDLWFYALKYVSYLYNHTANEKLKWKTPIEKAFGNTPDISSLLEFYFYQPI